MFVLVLSRSSGPATLTNATAMHGSGTEPRTGETTSIADWKMFLTEGERKQPLIVLHRDPVHRGDVRCRTGPARQSVGDLLESRQLLDAASLHREQV